jgi:hypothetical protein
VVVQLRRGARELGKGREQCALGLIQLVKHVEATPGSGLVLLHRSNFTMVARTW